MRRVSAAAGAWGARVGPPFVRRLQDTERPLVLAGLVLVNGGVALALLAGAVAALVGLDRDDGTTWLLVGGALLLWSGASIFTTQSAARWWWSRRRPGRPVVATAPSGASSTAVPRSRAALVMPWTSALTLLTTGVVLTVGSIGRWAWATTVFGLLTAALLLRVIPLATGRAAAGGVYCTPLGLETRWGVERASIPWDAVLLRPDTLGFVRTDAAVVDRTFPVQMPIDVTDQVVGRAVAVPPPYLAVREDTLRALLHLGMHNSTARAQLGTPPSLDWHLGATPT